MTSSVVVSPSSLSGAMPRSALSIVVARLSVSVALSLFRSLSAPMCVATSPASTVESIESLRLAGSLPTRRPSICCVRMSVSPCASTTQTVASHWEVLRPMSGTR